MLRKFLLPFSVPYGFLMRMRNILYDKDILSSQSFSTSVIVVGNLSIGGTGKTPMIEYLIEYLLPHYNIAVLSRGYGRKTKGFIELNGNEDARMVGDEPLQFKTKYPEAIVVVDEDRRRGISEIVFKYDPDVVLLDDAYQHRKVKAGFNILLTRFDSIYTDDFVLPAGNLREPASGADRADVIVVTKCPDALSENEQERLQKKLKLNSNQQLFFSFIKYSDFIVNASGKKADIDFLSGKKFTLVTGIAKPKPLIKYLQKKMFDFDHLQFPDHHNFSKNEMAKISEAHIILTTEKDFMRLMNSISHPQFYYIPIKTEFIDRTAAFQNLVQDFLNEK